MDTLPAVRDLQLARLPDPRRRADDQPDRLLDPPDPGHGADGDQAARGRGAGVLRARAAARGDRRPPVGGRDRGRRGGRPARAPLPDAAHGPRRRRRPPLRRPLPLAVVLGPVRPPRDRGASSPARSSAACSATATRTSRSPRAPPAPSARTPGCQLQLLDFTDSYDTDHRRPHRLREPGDRAQERAGDRPPRRCASTTRCRYDGTTFYQASFGSAAVMTIKDEAGKALATEGIPFAWQLNADEPVARDLPRPRHRARWSGSSAPPARATRGSSPARSRSRSTRLRREQRRSTTRSSTRARPTTVGGLTMTFEREAQFTAASTWHATPACPLVWIGALLLFGGLRHPLHVPAQARLGPHRGRAPTAAPWSAWRPWPRRTSRRASEFENLVTDIRAALQAPAQSLRETHHGKDVRVRVRGGDADDRASRSILY